MTNPTARLDPRRTALLVMDYQPTVLGSLGNPERSAELLERVRAAIATVRNHGGHVGYVRVAFNDAEVDAIPPHSRMFRNAEMARTHLRKDAAATAVHAEVAPADGDIVVRKTRIGAFSTTDLDETLRARDITALLLAGVSTSGVVLSTVRDAHDRDYAVYVLADATADHQPHVHDFLIQQVFPEQADVIDVDELGALLAPAETRDGGED